MSYYVLKHHGILGQKWGKRNGPPYPLDAEDHSAAEKKAGWKESLKNKKEQKQIVKNLRKSYRDTKTGNRPMLSTYHTKAAKLINDKLSDDDVEKLSKKRENYNTQRDLHSKDINLYNNLKEREADKYADKRIKYENYDENDRDMLKQFFYDDIWEDYINDKPEIKK